MGLGSFLSKLVGGGGGEKPPENVEYEGYTICPAPRSQGGQFLTAGVISKTFPDGAKEQTFVRADTHSSREAACSHAIMKAQQIIDEQGDKLFGVD